jgi:hypothetical protein
MKRLHQKLSVVSLSLLSVLLSACVDVPKEQVPQLMALPATTQTASKVIVARKDQIAGSYPTYYLTFNGKAVAKLQTGQYTELVVDPGKHILGVVWFGVNTQPGYWIDGFYFPPIYFTGEKYSNDIEVELQSGINYRFLIHCCPPQLTQYETWPDDIAIDEYNFVPAGIEEDTN